MTNPTAPFTRHHYRRNEVYARLVKTDNRRSFQARLLELYRRARRELQEGGANTLYLVVDVMVWKESEDSDRELVAPLTLVPIELTRKSVAHNFELALFDDAPRFNPGAVGDASSIFQH